VDKKTLASSTADWLVVVGHYPVYSVGEHGSTEYLIKHVLPLMLDNKVAMYVDGHDHGMQHNFDGKVHFFVSGAGAKSEAQDHHNLPSPAQNKYAWPKDSGDEALCLAEHFEHCYGFMVFDLEPTSLTAHIYSSTSGKKKYSVNVPNPRA
jgi:tartrate-resistant acid phosphatase type 5